jgi:hypothetical protein
LSEGEVTQEDGKPLTITVDDAVAEIIGIKNIEI